MEACVHVKLKELWSVWDQSSLRELARARKWKAYCQALLPGDFSDGRQLPERLGWYLGEHGRLDGKAIQRLLNGNRRSLRGGIRSLGCAEFTEDLIELLNTNAPFGTQKQTPRQSLFDKLCTLIAGTEPRLTKDSRLFRQTRLEPDRPGGVGAEAYEKLRLVQQRLLLLGTPQALGYGVMILVLAAWLQWRVEDIPWLWDWEQVGEYLTRQTPQREHFDAGEHVPFTDPSYMGRYEAFLFRSSRGHLFEKGTLTLEPEPPFGCRMTLELCYQSGSDPDHIQRRSYSGTPLLSPRDGCVYGLLTDKDGAIAHLYFQYKAFQANMYFRVGLLVTEAANDPWPLCRRMVLAVGPVPGWKIPYVEGILSASGDQIILTEPMLEQFCQRFREAHYPWFERFERRILPGIREAIRHTQVYNTQRIRAEFLGEFPEEEVVQITLALRSLAIPGFERERGGFPCRDPGNYHQLFR